MLALQRTIGNRAVAQLLARQAVAAPAPPAEGVPGRSCARARRTPTTATRRTAAHPDEPTRITDPTGGGDVELLQLKLNWHLSAMRRRGLIVDGDFGGATAKAVIAFKRFHKMKPANAVVDGATWAALDADPTVVAPTGREREGPGARSTTASPRTACSRSRSRSASTSTGSPPASITSCARARRGARLHARSHPRGGAARRGGAPAAGRGRRAVRQGERRHLARQPVHCVLRLIGPAAPGEDGTASATAAALALDESEVFEYGGHARYGTGPDFDRNYTITRPLGPGAGAPARRQHGRRGHELRPFMHAFASATTAAASRPSSACARRGS